MKCQNPKLRQINRLVVGTVVSFLIGCSASVDPTDRNLLEHERVWQFCKLFSLYQDQIPSHREALQNFEFPGEIVESLPDTLHTRWNNHTFRIGGYATNYDSLIPNLRVSFSSVSVPVFQRVETLRLTTSTLYMRIPEFYENSGEEVKSTAKEYGGVSSIIVDLIDNPGGSIDECIKVIEEFLPAGKEYLYAKYREFSPNYENSRTVHRVWASKRDGGILENLRISILVNRGSASASEILTVALRDVLGAERVYVLGDWTYGKAIGQYVKIFQSSGAGIKLTGFRFHRIDSASKADYHEIGIMPDSKLFNDSSWVSQSEFQTGIEEALRRFGDTDSLRVHIPELYARYHLQKRYLSRAGAFVDLDEQSLPGFQQKFLD